MPSDFRRFPLDTVHARAILRAMSKQEEPTVPKGVRWPADVLRKVARLARRDKLAFSPEAVELVRLGIEAREARR